MIPSELVHPYYALSSGFVKRAFVMPSPSVPRFPRALRRTRPYFYRCCEENTEGSSSVVLVFLVSGYEVRIYTKNKLL